MNRRNLFRFFGLAGVAAVVPAAAPVVASGLCNKRYVVFSDINGRCSARYFTGRHNAEKAAYISWAKHHLPIEVWDISGNARKDFSILNEPKWHGLPAVL